MNKTRIKIIPVIISPMSVEELQKENDELKMRLFGSRMEIRKLKLELEKVKNSLKQQQEDNTTTTDEPNERRNTSTIHYQPDDSSTGGGG